MSRKSVTKTVSAVTSGAVENTREEKEIKRDAIFTRWERPLGLQQETFNILLISTVHILAAYITYLNLVGKAPWRIFYVELLFGVPCGLGTTIGAHRYWTHKTFKAKRPLEYLLMIVQTIAFQYPLHKWCLDHRIHHKYTDTDADPYNSKRGFWYSHVGWLFLPKREDLKRKLKTFPVPDLESDPVVRFQSEWYWTLVAVFHYIIPMSVTYYIWRLPLLYCLATACRRHVWSLHFTWNVNSFAHIYGDKPYDKNISSTEGAIVSFFAVGEGWHNYHHTFPWDYKASEFGWKVNASTVLIDFFAYMGWAYDLKTVSHKMLTERQRRTGDGSNADPDITGKSSGGEGNGKNTNYITSSDVTERMKSVEEPVWGWEDESLTDDFREITTIMKPEAVKCS